VSGLEDPVDRAEMWLQRGRFDKAEPELREALATDPDNAELLAQLARCVTETDRKEEATEIARRAVGQDPGHPYCHEILAYTLLRRGRGKEAAAAARQALRLDADDPDLWSVLGDALCIQRRWEDAERAARRGLSLDPEHTGCLNVRAFARLQRGKREAADVDFGAALRHDPDNPATHCNIGLAALRTRDHARARTHFREALRLDPSLGAAREGLVEALKASNPVYGWLLYFMLQLTRIDPRWVFGILILTVFARRFLRSMADENPAASPYLMAVFWLLAGAVLLTWFASPLMAFALMLSRDGRMVLDRLEKAQALTVSCCLAAALGFGVVAAAGAVGWETSIFVCAGLGMLAAIGLGDLPRRWRRPLRVATAGLACVGVLAAVDGYRYDRWRDRLLTTIGNPPQEVLADREAAARHLLQLPEERQQRFQALAREKPARETELFYIFLIGTIAMTWIAPALGLFGRVEH